MIGIPIGLVYANGAEWVIHKHVLHGLGKRKSNFWSFHWHEHHRAARRNEHRDDGYARSVFVWNGQGKEALALTLGLMTHLPLFPVAPFFTGTLVYSALRYYYVHRKAHLDTDWARENLPWHYDHHMGPDQDANWCVTRPWFDYLMGTRKPYVGTAQEEADREKSGVRRRAPVEVRPLRVVGSNA